MRENLEWCVSNAVSDDHSENLGRCVYHSTNLDCQESIQVSTFKIPTYSIIFVRIVLEPGSAQLQTEALRVGQTSGTFIEK